MKHVESFTSCSIRLLAHKLYRIFYEHNAFNLVGFIDISHLRLFPGDSFLVYFDFEHDCKLSWSFDLDYILPYVLRLTDCIYATVERIDKTTL